jgi:hypothetical protein
MKGRDLLKVLANANRLQGAVSGEKCYVEYADVLDNEVGIQDYCGIGLSSCFVCGWVGEYPVSGCPNCNRSFVE